MKRRYLERTIKNIIIREYLYHIFPITVLPLLSQIINLSVQNLLFVILISVVLSLYMPLLYNTFGWNRNLVQAFIKECPRSCREDFTEFEKLFKYGEFKQKSSFVKKCFKSVFTFFIFTSVTLGSKYIYENVSLFKIFEDFNIEKLALLFILFGPLTIIIIDFGRIVSGDYILERIMNDLYEKIYKMDSENLLRE